MSQSKNLRVAIFAIITVIVSSSSSLVAAHGASSATPKTGSACPKLGLRQADVKGFGYECEKVGKKLIWSAPHPGGIGQSGSGQSGSGQSGSGQEGNPNSFALGNFGEKCNKNGLVAWNGQMAATCKNGRVAYTLATDVPPTPKNGYSARPSWYPTLAQIFRGQSGKEPTCSPSSIKFTQPVLPLDQLAPSIPYGMTVGGHVTPIDHAYLGLKTLYLSDAVRSDTDYLPITAPADGTIIELGSLGSPDSHRVVIDHGCNVYSVYMVIN